MDPVGPKCPIKLLPVKQASDCGTDITGKTTVYPGAAAEPEIRYQTSLKWRGK